MANYYSTARTNYFRVTDEEKYAELFKKLKSEDGPYDFTETDKNGVVWHGFGGASIDYYPEYIDNEGDVCEDDPDFDLFAKKLQDILPEDEAFIYMESGAEKLRYVVGACAVVTKDGYEWMSIGEMALNKARELLGNKKFQTRMEY